MTSNLDILSSPGFLFGLALLLLNDFIFKNLFHNSFTGKLSDFAGLFIFPLFWTSFFPAARKHIYLLVALLFIFWKSVSSQFMIDAWNGLHLFQISRAVDASDLLALLVLPLSYAYGQSRPADTSNSKAPYLLALVAVFAFTATSREHSVIQYGKEYRFHVSRAQLFERINRLQLVGFEVGHPPTCCPKEPVMDTYPIFLRAFCTSGFGALADIKITESGRDTTIMTLRNIDYDCPQGANDKEELLKVFEKEVIDKLSQSR
jgi:hypothetical protein